MNEEKQKQKSLVVRTKIWTICCIDKMRVNIIYYYNVKLSSAHIHKNTEIIYWWENVQLKRLYTLQYILEAHDTHTKNHVGVALRLFAS